jgi:TonB family protein
MKTNSMQIRQRKVVKTLLLIAVALLATMSSIRRANAQIEEEGGDRKVVTRVEPEYPETLKRLYIGGVVRVATTVAPNGTVEDAELLGGNPVLGQAAMKAIKQWKYASNTSKEKLVIKITFDPHR